MHMLLNISRVKGNQTMQFRQLIEYNKKNILLKKSFGEWDDDTSRRPLFF